VFVAEFFLHCAIFFNLIKYEFVGLLIIGNVAIFQCLGNMAVDCVEF